MAVPTSFRTTTSGSLKLNTQNSGDLLLHPPSRALRSQTTISFPTMKVLGSNPKAAHHLPTCTPTKAISQTFTKLKSEGKVALIPYITAGDPDLSTTAQALKLLDSCGANVIELGIPFSDPLLDGPVIRASASRSLVGGTNLSKIISMLEEVVPQLSCPITIFSYANPILKHGVENFMSQISQAGVRGLVVPDASFECPQLRNEAAKKNVEMVLLTTPATRTDRMKDIVQASEGFVYLVSSVGVTGARERVNKQVPSLLREIKEVTSKPVAVGFGLSKPEHFKQVAEWGADGAIVGSAIVKVLGEARSSLQGLRELETLAKSFKSALP